MKFSISLATSSCFLNSAMRVSIDSALPGAGTALSASCTTWRLCDWASSGESSHHDPRRLAAGDNDDVAVLFDVDAVAVPFDDVAEAGVDGVAGPRGLAGAGAAPGAGIGAGSGAFITFSTGVMDWGCWIGSPLLRGVSVPTPHPLWMTFAHTPGGDPGGDNCMARYPHAYVRLFFRTQGGQAWPEDSPWRAYVRMHVPKDGPRKAP